MAPDIQVTDVDLDDTRRLVLRHRVLEGILLHAEDARRVLQHIADLWGYEVVMEEVDAGSGATLKEHRVAARPGVFF